MFPIIALLGVLSVAEATVGGTSLSIHHQLSPEIAEALSKMGETLAALQGQLDSVAGVALQNQRAPDLLAASEGRICLYLKEECCFYVNKSGQVQ